MGILPVPCAVLCDVFIISLMQTTAHSVRLGNYVSLSKGHWPETECWDQFSVGAVPRQTTNDWCCAAACQTLCFCMSITCWRWTNTRFINRHVFTASPGFILDLMSPKVRDRQLEKQLPITCKSQKITQSLALEFDTDVRPCFSFSTFARFQLARRLHA